MSRLIDADELKERGNKQSLLYNEFFNRLVDESKTIDAEPIRHGRWEYDVETAGFKCTECGKRIWGMTLEIASGDINYCPKCGAKMDGRQNETDNKRSR